MSEEKRARHLHPGVVVGVIVVIGVLAALPFLLGGEPVDEPATLPGPSPAPTETPSPTPTPAPEPTPTGTPTDSPAEEPSPSPEEVPTSTVAQGASLEGRVAVSDETGDVTDTAGDPPPQPEPAVDLVEVELVGEAEMLTVIFRTAGPVPQGGPRSLVWSIDLYAADEPRYTITVQQLGARRFTGVLDWETLEQVEPPEPPRIEGTQIEVQIPAGLLPDLPVPFRWQALGQVDGGYEDRAPDGERASFP